MNNGTYYRLWGFLIISCLVGFKYWCVQDQTRLANSGVDEWLLETFALENYELNRKNALELTITHDDKVFIIRDPEKSSPLPGWFADIETFAAGSQVRLWYLRSLGENWIWQLEIDKQLVIPPDFMQKTARSKAGMIRIAMVVFALISLGSLLMFLFIDLPLIRNKRQSYTA